MRVFHFLTIGKETERAAYPEPALSVLGSAPGVGHFCAQRVNGACCGVIGADALPAAYDEAFARFCHKLVAVMGQVKPVQPAVVVACYIAISHHIHLTVEGDGAGCKESPLQPPLTGGGFKRIGSLPQSGEVGGVQ